MQRNLLINCVIVKRAQIIMIFDKDFHVQSFLIQTKCWLVVANVHILSLTTSSINSSLFNSNEFILFKGKTTWNIIEHFPYFIHTDSNRVYFIIDAFHHILLDFALFVCLSIFKIVVHVPHTIFRHTSYGMHAMHLILSGLDSWFIWYDVKEHQSFMVAYDVRHSNRGMATWWA